MILIGYIIWLMIAVLVGRAVARHIKTGRKTALAAGWGAGVLVALLPYWDVILGAPVMLDMCTKKGGLHVYADIQWPLSSVHVFDEDRPSDNCLACREILVRGMATEVQFNVVPLASGRIDPSSLVTHAGPVRYWISKDSDPFCAPYLQWSGTIHDRRRYWASHGGTYGGDECIAAQPISEITARYQLSFSLVREQRGIASIDVREVRLTQGRNRTSVASLAYIEQYPWTQQRFYYALPPVPSCPSPQLKDPVTGQRLGNAFSYMSLLNQVFRTTGNQGVTP